MYIPLLKYDRHFIYHDQTDGIGITALYTQADFVIITVRKNVRHTDGKPGYPWCDKTDIHRKPEQAAAQAALTVR